MAVIAASAVLLLAVVGAFYLATGSKDESFKPAPSWYYDLGDGELFTIAEVRLPPIPTPSDADDAERRGVIARLFSCGRCNTAKRFIGWLETYTAEGRRRIKGFADQAPRDALVEMVGNDLLIAAPPESPGGAVRWHGYNTAEAEAIREAAMSRCEDGAPTECLP